MITIPVNNALERAKLEAIECAEVHGGQWAVVIGYDDYDRLCWTPVPLAEVGHYEEAVFITRK